MHEHIDVTQYEGTNTVHAGISAAQLESVRAELSEAARDKLAAAGFDPVYGARPLKRAIQQQVENPLAQEILKGRFSPGDAIEVGVTDDRLDFKNAA